MGKHSLPGDRRAVTGAERRWVLVYAAVVMLLTTLPYLAGYARQGQDWRFTGFVFAVEDGNSYIAKMLSGSQGAWLFRTPYTPHPQNGVMAFLPYLVLGKLATPPGVHEQLVALFHLFRIGAGLLAILATYDFLSMYLSQVPWRRLALVIATLGGGIGWLSVLLGWEGRNGSLPLEFYSPESFGFLALYGLPHLSLARAFLLWGLRAYLVQGQLRAGVAGAGLRPAQEDRSSWPFLVFSKVRSGIFFLLIGLGQPLTVVVAWILIGAHLGGLILWQAWLSWRGNRIDRVKLAGYARQGAVSVAISMPVVLYTAWAFNRDPFLRAWAAQNLILSPPPLQYLLAYGLMIPFALYGTAYLLRKDAWRASLPAVWVLLLPFLAYAPYNLQRRLPEGVWIAIVVLAIAALEGWRASRPRWKAAASLVFIFVFPAAIILLAGGLFSGLSPGKPVFRPAPEVAAFRALGMQASAGEVVLAAYETGNALPAWAPLRVVIGHGPESARLAELRPLVADFYQAGTSEARRLAFLQTYAISYVFWGPAEQALGQWDPGEADYLKPVYLGGEIKVYKVDEFVAQAGDPALP